MKKFEHLTNAEKQKLSTYLQYINFLTITTVMILLTGFSVFVIGYAILFIFVVPVIMITGVFLVFCGIVLIFVSVLGMIRDKKYLFLIFGYRTLYSDIFGIKNEDIKKVKIIREVKWIKEK